MRLICYYWILFTSLIAFLLFGEDKKRAKKRGRRIPERVLWSLVLLGGGTGAFLGMQIFRHKTKHLSFALGVPACTVITWIIIYLLHLYL